MILHQSDTLHQADTATVQAVPLASPDEAQLRHAEEAEEHHAEEAAERSRPAQHPSPERREEAPSGPLATPDAAQVVSAVEQINCSLPSPQQSEAEHSRPAHPVTHDQNTAKAEAAKQNQAHAHQEHPNCGAAAGSHPCIKAG